MKKRLSNKTKEELISALRKRYIKSSKRQKTKIINEFIEISVNDTGIGIPKENVEKIFMIDSNISTPGTEEEEGTGLGLIISREFIEKNGGTINVNSIEGKGTQFMFTVPIYKD